MKIESHLDNLRESIMEIEEAIQKGLSLKQRTIGFHTSAAAIDILEIILHQKNLIDSGFIIKHEWFNSQRKIDEKFPFDFPNKEKIIFLMVEIETIRNKLCYGKRQSEEILQQTIDSFNKLKVLFEEVTGYEL